MNTSRKHFFQEGQYVDNNIEVADVMVKYRLEEKLLAMSVE